MPAQKEQPAQITPSHLLTWPGLETTFEMRVKKKKVDALWSLSVPAIGTIGKKTGRFKAAKELRYGLSEVHGESVDGKYKVKAQVRIMMGWGVGNYGLQFADNFLKIPTISWNTHKGIRGAKLIVDARAQLPRWFLDRIGDVALVRSNWISSVASGMHLPLPGRVVLLSDEIFQRLTYDPGITIEDHDFVRTFVHELAHVVLANDCLNDFARWKLLLTAAGGLAAGIYGGAVGGGAAAGLIGAGWGAVSGGIGAGIVAGTALMVTADYAALLAEYYATPWAQKDLAYRFADKTGWQIRDPNPIALFWGGKVPPNVITGYRFVGPLVGLENKFAPKSQDEAEWGAAGFARPYSGTDVHEDFADVIRTLAMGSPKFVKNARFDAAKQFMNDEKIWPNKHSPIDVGSTAIAYSKKHFPKNKASFQDFGVFLGLYAGGDPRDGTSTVKIPPNAKQLKADTQAKEIKALLAEKEDSSQVNIPAQNSNEGQSDEAPFAEGYAKRWDEDEVAEAFEIIGQIDQIEKAHEHYIKETAQVIDETRQIVNSLPVEIREGSLLELLRSAECHGEGLQYLEADPKTKLVVIEGGTKVSDMLFTNDQSMWVVTRAAEGIAKEILGTPRITEKGKVAEGFDPLKVVFFWRPTNSRRVWYMGQPEEEMESFVRVVRLWGLEESGRKNSLFKSGTFVTEVLVAFGKQIKGLDGEDDKTTREYCAAHGGLLKPKDAGVQTRDIVRLRNSKWGFVLRTKPLDIVVQGGGKGTMGEDEYVVKIIHGMKPTEVTDIWRFAGKLPTG